MAASSLLREWDPSLLDSGLQVAEPPVVATLFQAGKPPACRVEQDNYTEPHGVRNPEVVTVACRIGLPGSAHGRQGSEKEAAVPVAQISQHYRGDMNGEQVHQEVEQ